MKERHIVVWVITATVLILAVALFSPSKRDQLPVNLPWQIDTTTEGRLKIFGLTLGESTLAEARQLFREEAEVSLFASKEGVYEVEAYFDTLDLGGLRAKMVMTMDLSAEQREAMFNRGVRISTLGSGERRVTLADADLATVQQTPIIAITYLPRVNLSAEVVRKHFGEPAMKIQEKGTDIVHWLYPEKGLDIALSDKQKDVLQYVLPGRFQQVLEPLQAKGESVK